MPKFELLDEKVAWNKLKDGDYVSIGDQLWRVHENFPVLGGGTMLKLSFHTHTDPRKFKFEAVRSLTDDQRIEVFRKID